jgi:hypothetical protein
MLDLFGKAKPIALTRSLQIDRQNARLLVGSLSGRWSLRRTGATSTMAGTT